MAPLALGVARLLRPAETGFSRVHVRLALASVALCVTAKAGMAMVPNDRDMRALHRAVVTAGGPDARVVAVNHAKLNGLHYYLDGKIEHVWINTDPDHRAEDLRAIMPLLKSRAHPVVLIGPATHPQVLPRILKAESIPFQEHRSTFWQLLVIPEDPSHA